MLTKEEKWRIEREISELYINRSDNFDDVAEFVEPRFQCEVRIMALWKLNSISESREQKDFVLSQSFKFKETDLYYEALSGIHEILLDPLEVSSYFIGRYSNNAKFQALRTLALTKSLKRVIEQANFMMILQCSKISGVDEDYKKILSDKILASLFELNFEEMISIVNKPNVLYGVNLSIWSKIVQAAPNEPVPVLLDAVRNRRLAKLQAQDLLNEVCGRADELSVSDALDLYLIANNRRLGGAKTISIERIEFLLPNSDIDDLIKICKMTIGGTMINKIALATIKNVMLNANQDDIKHVYHKSIGHKRLNDLAFRIMQIKSPDIKVWSL